MVVPASLEWYVPDSVPSLVRSLRHVRTGLLSRRVLTVLSVLLVAALFLGVAFGAGVGAADEPESDGGELDSLTVLSEENESQVDVALAEYDGSDVNSFDVVVRFDGSVVSGELAKEESDEIPVDGTIEYEGNPLIINNGVVEVYGSDDEVTVNDESIIQETGSDPDIRVDDGGAIELDTEDEVFVSGSHDVKVEEESLEYDIGQENDVEAEFTEVRDSGSELEVDVTFINPNYDEVDRITELHVVDGSEKTSIYDELVSLEAGGVEERTLSGSVEIHSGLDTLELEIDGTQFETELDIDAGIDIDILWYHTLEGTDLEIEVEFERVGDLPLTDRNATISVGDETLAEDLDLGGGDTDDDLTAANEDGTTASFTYDDINSTEFLDSDETVVVEIENEDGETTAESELTDEVKVTSKSAYEQNHSANITNVEFDNLSDGDVTVDIDSEYNGTVPNGGEETNATLEIGQQEFEIDLEVDDENTFETELNETLLPISEVSIELPEHSHTYDLEQNSTLEYERVDDPFTSHSNVTVDVTLNNTGTAPLSENLSVSVDDSDSVVSAATQSRTVSLNVSENRSERFEFEPTEGASTELTITANTSEANATETTTRPAFEIDEIELEGADDAHAGLSMSGTVTNVGEKNDTQLVQFVLAEEIVAEESITLEPNESATVSVDIEPPEEDGEYAYGMTANYESATGADDRTATIENTAGPSLLDRLVSVLLPLLLFAILVAGILALRYRNDPDEFYDDVDRVGTEASALASTALNSARSTIAGLLGNDSGTVVVQNGLGQETTVRLRVRDSDDIVYLEDMTLQNGERRELRCLPGEDQFEVGAGVSDGTSNAEVFQNGARSVGVVLQRDGISIGEV